MELFYSVDIEADGPIPGKYSMLSFGTAVFTRDGKLVNTYEANLDVLPDAEQHPDTMEWWKTQPEAWEVCRKNTRPAELVMPEFVDWVRNVQVIDPKYNKPVDAKYERVFVGYPAGFDFTFMYWYMIAFAGESPFSFSALDMKSFAMPILGMSFRKTTKRNFPREWFGKSRHTHVAVDDAIEQGEMFCNILKAADGFKRNR